MKRFITLLLASLLGIGFANANERFALHVGHLVDVDAGAVRDDLYIVIDGERIAAVQKQAPADMRIDDWTRYTVLPGLIDCHTHLIGDVMAPLAGSQARDVLMGVKNARATLLAGFTSVRDVGVYRAFTDVALRDAINDGTVIGPRMAVAGAYVTVSGGGGEVTGIAAGMTIPAEFRRGVANNESEIRQRVREILEGRADFIKVIATGAVLTNGTDPGASEYSEAQIHAAVDEAAKHGTYVAAHAHGAEGVKNAIRAGVRSIEHGSLMDDEGVALMKQHGTFFSADIYNGDYIAEVGKRDGWDAEILRKNDETTETQRVAFRKAAKAGVRIVFGTDAGVYPHGWNANQFPYLVRYGLTPMQAIQAATINAAQLMSREKDVGSIQPGKYADLLAVDGDVLTDIALLSKVEKVMKGGEILK